MIKIKNLKCTCMFEVEIPLYNTRIMITYGNSEPAIKKFLEGQSPEWKEYHGKSMKKQFKVLFRDEKSRSEGMFIPPDGKGTLPHIHLFRRKDSLELIRFASHESLHAAFWVLDRVGVKYSGKSEEAFTYLQDYILSHVLEGIAKQADELEEEIKL